MTLSEISESCNKERDTGLIGDFQLGYEGLNEMIKEIDIDGELELRLSGFSSGLIRFWVAGVYRVLPPRILVPQGRR